MAEQSTTRPAKRSVWWLWPAAPIVLLVIPTLLAANAIDAEVYERAWRTPKILDAKWTLVLFAGMMALVIGTMVAAMAERSELRQPAKEWPSLSIGARIVLGRMYPALVILTLLGYVVWIGNGLRNGLTFADVNQVLTTQDNFKLPIKQKLETLPGITTLTQVAVTAVIVGVLLDLDSPNIWIRRAYRLVILLATIRGLMLAERLAAAELVVPLIVLRGAALAHRLRGSKRLLLSWAPIIGAVALIGGFAASEYTRSWTFYENARDQSFAAFASERLLGYYATSHNNGVLILDHPTGTQLPIYTTAFAWEIPPGSVIASESVISASDQRGDLLSKYANPEFNSVSGIASPFSDWGMFGGLVFFTVHGFLIGVLHLSFMRGRPIGVLFYPIVFIGLLEMPRYLYWYQGRATPALLASAAAVLFIAIDARRRLGRLSLVSAVRPTGAAT